MPWETFKARSQRERGEMQDVFHYDFLPQKFRVQFSQICEEYFGAFNDFRGTQTASSKNCEQIVKILRREFGVHALSGNVGKSTDYGSWWQELKSVILLDKDVEIVISTIEIICYLFDRPVQNSTLRENGIKAVEETNLRMKQSAVGYYFSESKIIRVDSEYLHQDAVIPAINILHMAHFGGAKQEFLDAHQAYRENDKTKALLEAAKSFESLMKAICDKRGWVYAPTATASKLIEVCMTNDLIPTFWQTHFTGLRTILESSVITARNKLAGHGSGTSPIEIPDEMVPYVMHMTAATLLFLAERDAAMP